MQYLIIVLNNGDYLDEVLEAFLELGISGATVLDSTGMGQIISRDLPIFAGFKNAFSVAQPSNKTIFTIVKDEQVPPLMDAVEQVVGSFNKRGVGIAFSVPVIHIRGLGKSLIQENEQELI
ncbi:MAG TPA: hypothetical protein ENN84_01870 [Candidatus Marinimicrobia bacterium]|nr:hypothetical protein [Candidatus Neomarinimicrobiota bacterium]